MISGGESWTMRRFDLRVGCQSLFTYSTVLKPIHVQLRRKDQVNQCQQIRAEMPMAPVSTEAVPSYLLAIVVFTMGPLSDQRPFRIYLCNSLTLSTPSCRSSSVCPVHWTGVVEGAETTEEVFYFQEHHFGMDGISGCQPHHS